MESIDQVFSFALRRGFSAYVPEDGELTPGILEVSPFSLARLRRYGLLCGAALENALRSAEGEPRPVSCLVYSASDSAELWGSQPPSSIRSWMESARVGWLQESPTQRLYLLDQRPLSDLVVLYSDLHPDTTGENVQVEHDVLAMILKNGNFDGRSLICNFGEPLCSSEFAWARNGRLLWYMGGSGGWIFHAHLLPVLTVEDKKEG